MFVHSTSIDSCLHWWTFERVPRSSAGEPLWDSPILETMYKAETVLTLMFKALDSLHNATRSVPRPWTMSEGVPASIGGTGNLLISIPISPNDYALLRTVLSLTADIYHCSKTLTTECKGHLMELEPLLQQVLDSAKPVYSARNLFTHLDEYLVGFDKHGVDGPMQTRAGITFTGTAKNNLYIVLAGDKLHYPRKKKPQEVDVGKAAFNAILDKARLVYGELAGHKLHADHCGHVPTASLYPVVERPSTSNPAVEAIAEWLRSSKPAAELTFETFPYNPLITVLVAINRASGSRIGYAIMICETPVPLFFYEKEVAEPRAADICQRHGLGRLKYVLVFEDETSAARAIDDAKWRTEVSGVSEHIAFVIGTVYPNKAPEYSFTVLEEVRGYLAGPE